MCWWHYIWASGVATLVLCNFWVRRRPLSRTAYDLSTHQRHLGAYKQLPPTAAATDQGSHEGARALPIFGKMPFQVPFLQTHFQCLRQLFLMASCDIRAQRDTPYARCPCISVVPETTLEGRHISSKVTRELLGGTTGNSDS